MEENTMKMKKKMMMMKTTKKNKKDKIKGGGYDSFVID